MRKIIKQVKIHGLLASFFGDVVKINISNINNIINAIDCIKSGFRKKMKELLEKGYNYDLVYDKENENCIHIIPLISGSGRVAMYIIGAILIVIAVVMMFVPGLQPASGALLTFVVTTLFSTGVSLIITAATLPKTPQAETRQSYQNIGGSVLTKGVDGQSFIFSNEYNSGSQGSAIPLGYGKLKIGSRILQSTIFSYEMNQQFLTQSQIDLLVPPFFDYLAN